MKDNFHNNITYSNELQQIIMEAGLEGLASNYVLARKILCMVCNDKSDTVHKLLNKKMIVKMLNCDEATAQQLIDALLKHGYVFLLPIKKNKAKTLILPKY